MTPEQHQRVSELFLAVSGLQPGERAAVLETSCPNDPELRHEVETLLERDDDQSEFLSAPPAVSLTALIGLDGRWNTARATESGPKHDYGGLRLIGSRIAAYTLLEEIGKGGMAIVYRAEQERPRREVALKLIRNDLVSPSTLRRFENEAEVLGRLRHPGIVQVFEAGIADIGDGPQPFIAMELIDGVPLTHFADKQELEIDARLALMVRICEAVQHAHQRGIIHRDLKPANILVDAADRPKVLDFGVARAIDAEPGNNRLQTSCGEFLGTLAYMSPEQLNAGAADVDTRSDVYGLGVVCYELLVGRLPYDLAGTTFLKAARIILEEPPIPVRRLGPQIPSDIEHILAKALEKEPDARYASVHEFAQDIARHLRHEPIRARAASAGYRANKFIRRNRLRLTLIGALVAVVLGGGWAARYAAVQRRTQTVQRLVADGNALLKAKQLNEAQERFQAALDLAPNDFAVLGNFAVLKKEIINTLASPDQSLLEDAADLARRALELNSNHPNLWNIQGVLLKKLHRLPEAVDAYWQAARLEPLNSAAWANLGTAYALMSDLSEARTYLGFAVSVPSPDCGAWPLVAAVQLYDDDPRFSESITHALRCYPQKSMPFALRARSNLRAEASDQWLSALQDAATADTLAGEQHPGVKRIRALARLRNRQYDAAIHDAELAKGLGDDPAYDNLIIVIAQAWLAQTAEAKENLREASRTWPPDLATAGSFRATADKGVLWLDTADELFALRNEAEQALEAARP